MRVFRQCAEQTIPSLVAHKLRLLASRSLVRCIDLGHDPKRNDAAASIAEAVARSKERLDRVIANEITPAFLSAEEHKLTVQAREDIESGRWRSSFRGREILRRFVSESDCGIRYEAFRDLIVARMRDAAFQPSGMATIIRKILADSWKNSPG